MTRFAELASLRSGHEELAFALGVELGSEVPDGGRDRLAELALDVRRSPDGLAELDNLCRVVRDSFTVIERGPLLLSKVLMRGGGQPDGLAVLAASVASRAQIDVDIVSDGFHLYLAHRMAGGPMVADVGRADPLIDGRTLGSDLNWQCGHESAFVILRQVAQRSSQTGDLATELASLALLLELPLSESARETYADHHRHLLARLN